MMYSAQVNTLTTLEEHNFFYFSNFQSFETLKGELVNYKLSTIDKQSDLAKLFTQLNVTTETLETWFDDFEPLTELDIAKAWYLSNYLNIAMENILDEMENHTLIEGSAIDYVKETSNYLDLLDVLLEDSPLSNAYVRIDYEAIAHDLECGGDISTFEFNGSTYTID